ncbi:MAG TPA: hypothetical protein DCP64_03410, partial [Sarcina sp.]|nr:hypothetical protein [Sarcina sp.]
MNLFPESCEDLQDRTEKTETGMTAAMQAGGHPRSFLLFYILDSGNLLFYTILYSENPGKKISTRTRQDKSIREGTR